MEAWATTSTRSSPRTAEGAATRCAARGAKNSSCCGSRRPAPPEATSGSNPSSSDSRTGVYDRSTYESVIAVLNRIQPDIVFVHGPDDYHADHRALSRMVLDASWVPVFYGDAEVGFTPDFYVDITDQMETKLAMCREYRSQDDDGWEKTIRLRGTFRGGESGLSGARYAEAFRQHRKSGWMSGYLLLPDLIPCSDGMIRFQFHNE